MKSQWSNQVFQTWISEDSSAVVNLLLRQYSAMLMQFEQRTPDFIQVFIDIYTNISRKEIKFKVSVGTRLFWLHNTNCKSVQQSDKNRLRLHLSQQKELWLDKPVAWVSDTEVCGRKWKADKFNNVWSHNLVWLKGEKNRKGRKKEEGERKEFLKGCRCVIGSSATFSSENPLCPIIKCGQEPEVNKTASLRWCLAAVWMQDP